MLRREALVVVIVPVEDHVDAVAVRDLVEVLRRRRAPVIRAAAEPRLMPIDERAVRSVRREVGVEPSSLLAARGTADDAAVRVERDEVPPAIVEAVPMLAERTDRSAPRPEVCVVA